MNRTGWIKERRKGIIAIVIVATEGHVWERLSHCNYRCRRCRLVARTLRDRKPRKLWKGGCVPDTGERVFDFFQQG